MNKFRIIIIYLILVTPDLLWAEAADKDVLSPKSLFQGNLLWTYGTETSLIYTPSDYHDGSRGHATQMFDLIRWNALNFPAMNQLLLLETSSLPYFSQIINARNVDFSSAEKKDAATAKRIISLLFDSGSPSLKVKEMISTFSPEQKSLMQEILKIWEDTVFQKYNVHVKTEITAEDYTARLAEEKNIVFFGYHVSKLTEEMTRKGANTYFFVSPNPEKVNESLQKKKEGAVKEILYPGIAGLNTGLKDSSELRFLGLPLSHELIARSRNADLNKSESEAEILREKESLYKQIVADTDSVPSWASHGKWLLMNTKETDKIRDFLPCCRNENRAESKACEVIFHVEHKTLSAFREMIKESALPEAFYQGLHGQLPFFSLMEGTFLTFADKKGTVQEAVSPSAASNLFSLKNVFYDSQKQQYYIYTHEGDPNSLYTPLYFKKLSGEKNVYELEIPEELKSLEFFHDNIRKPIRVELNEEALETVILNTPGVSPSVFQSLMNFGNKNNLAQKTVHLVSGTTTWMESLLLNTPALISGYSNDRTFYENIKAALLQASLPEETGALNQWIEAQDSLFDPHTHYEVKAEPFVKAFSAVREIFLRVLANPDYSMPENFARILAQNSQKEVGISS